MCTIKVLRIVFLGIFLLLGVSTVHGSSSQDIFGISGSGSSEQAPQKKDSVDVTKKELTLSELVAKSAEDYRFLENIEERLLDSATIAQEKRDVKVRIQAFGEFLADERNARADTLSYRELDNLERQLVRQKNAVTREIDDISSKVDRLDKEKDHIEEVTQFWERYRNEHDLTRENKVIRDKIREIKRKAQLAKPKFSKQLQELLILLDQLNDITLSIDEHTRTIESKISQSGDSLFTKTSSVIWEQATTFRFQGLKRNFSRFLSNSRADLQGVWVDFAANHVLMLLIVLILFGICLNIKKNKDRKKQYKDDYLGNVTDVFERPFATAVFLSFIFSIFIYYNAPNIFFEVWILLVLIPFIALGKMLFPDQVMRYIYPFMLFWLAIKIVEFVSYKSFTGRVILLITQVLFMVWVYRVLIKDHVLEKLEISEKWIRYLSRYFRVVGAIFVLSILANILGFLEISYYLSSVLIKITLFAVMLYLWNAIIHSLLFLLLEGTLGQPIKVVYRNRKVILKFLNRVVDIITAALLLYALLVGFSLSVSFFNWVSDFLQTERNIGSIAFTYGDIAWLVIIIWSSILISKIVRVILRDDILIRAGLSRGLPNTISMLVQYVIVTIGFFFALGAAGIELDRLAIIFGAFSVGIGFGLQNIFNNLVSGLILIFERPIHINDTIEVNSRIGTVRSIGIRSSNVRTFDGAEVVIPNGHLISNEVTNWTLSDKRRRIEVIVGVAYGSDVNKVAELLSKVLAEHKEIVDDPTPQVLFQEFGDSSLNFRLLFWTINFDDWIRIRSEVHFAINDILAEEGIEIPFPQRDVHVRSWEPLEVKEGRAESTTRPLKDKK